LVWLRRWIASRITSPREEIDGRAALKHGRFLTDQRLVGGNLVAFGVERVGLVLEFTEKRLAQLLRSGRGLGGRRRLLRPDIGADQPHLPRFADTLAICIPDNRREHDQYS